MTKTYTIEQKPSGTGSIHDISSDLFDREIVFHADCSYAVVDAAYYGGKGYTTHKTQESTAKASHRNRDYTHVIIDADGNEYDIDPRDHSRLVRK